MRKLALICVVMVLAFLPPPLLGEVDSALLQDSVTVDLPEPPAPPGNVTATDNPNDNGRAIRVTWELSADDTTGMKNVIGYRINRAEARDAADSLWTEASDILPSGTTEFIHSGDGEEDGPDYFAKNYDFYYRVHALTADTFSVSAVVGPVQAKDNWYNTGVTFVLLFVALFIILTVTFVRIARKGKELYIRPLAGIEAVDEAIGRATEMGKPTLYILGLGSAADIATIASFAILSRVAKKVAEYQTPLLVPCYEPFVMTVAQDTVRAAYMDAGRPDDYDEDSVYFVTSSQFAYVAGVMGTMIREKPATNFYLGMFHAESLLLAETGAMIGSIQIAGTDQIAQLPFFVVACDYTLIGEELYAASVYLSREPVLLGTIKAQDWAKAVVVGTILAGLLARLLVDLDFIKTVFEVSV
ncbi:MAG: fibronectin type III domain-containing protein [candidate division Zixibacteria bacterium]|nr:fibronectin type III domain-containing protein [candidate division Zixibacteria bacterium]